MATRDASSPALFTGSISASGTITSASFTAPANSVITVTVLFDGDSDAIGGTDSVSDSGGLTWTRVVTRTLSETTAGGGSSIWRAVQTTSASRTVTVTRTGGSGGAFRWTAVCDVWTGANTTTPFDSVGANNEGGSGTNNLTTTTITAGGAGVLLVAGSDWNANGAPTSSDLTVTTRHDAGTISVVRGYKTVAAGSVNGNLDAGGAGGAQWKWCQAVLRDAAVSKSQPPYPNRSRRFLPRRW